MNETPTTDQAIRIRRCAFPPCGAELIQREWTSPYCRKHDEWAKFVQMAVINILINIGVVELRPKTASGLVLPTEGGAKNV